MTRQPAPWADELFEFAGRDVHVAEVGVVELTTDGADDLAVTVEQIRYHGAEGTQVPTPVHVVMRAHCADGHRRNKVGGIPVAAAEALAHLLGQAVVRARRIEAEEAQR